MNGKQSKTRLNTVAYEYIKEQIMKQKLQAGMPIVESAIADKLGISRTPVREALKRLEEDGLVYSIPDTGSFVEHLTMQDVSELVELRILLENTALRYCIENAPIEEIEECERVTMSISEKDSDEELLEKDRAFHDLIARHCPNRRLLDFLNVIKLQQDRLRFSRSFDTKRRNRMKRQHLQLLGYIKTRDVRKAAKAMEKHLRTFLGFMHESHILNRKNPAEENLAAAWKNK